MKKIASFITGLGGLLLAGMASAQSTNPSPSLFFDLPDNTFAGIAAFITQLLLGLAGVVAILYIVVGGFEYMIAGVNEDLAKRAKRRIYGAVVGLIIIILSYTIVSVVVRTIVL